jgi:hypothetical protein
MAAPAGADALYYLDAQSQPQGPLSREALAGLSRDARLKAARRAAR